MKRSEQKLCNTFRMINDFLSDKENELYDKLHDIELSHNRKIKLLQAIKRYFEICPTKSHIRQTLMTKIEQELQFTGRLNYGARKK